MMAAGLITIAHASAGPKQDIIGSTEEPVGYLAKTDTEYIEYVVKAMCDFDSHRHLRLRQNAQKHVVDQFGIKSFNEKFLDMMKEAMHEDQSK
jgi:uncharacterized protein YaaR (DUF327 family)